ncbi:hypothetical protein MTQ01_23120 [Streptomyces sp. XM4193]|uniref:hypothetical protein n=1 Tax=Streptomyces sp. XM4193 TaxID=2929782 RepID=UPI001FFB2549|nr:hypothetical protein [Streptomyces sp. XM4193]MCK1798863.1 hypothetical protein [Streptomyces sp. XM4193]
MSSSPPAVRRATLPRPCLGPPAHTAALPARAALAGHTGAPAPFVSLLPLSAGLAAANR